MKQQKKRWNWMLVAAGIWFVWWLAAVGLPLARGESPVDLGLDLAGGVRVVYRPDFTNLESEWAGVEHSEILDRAKETLARRLSRGASVVPDVVVRGDERIAVTVPGDEGRSEVLERIGKTYRLDFRLVAPEIPTPDQDTFDYQGRLLRLAPAHFTGEMLDERSIIALAESADGFGGPLVAFRFAAPHDEAFGDFTREHRGDDLAILIDDEVSWVGRIESEIRDGGTLKGASSVAEAEELARLLRSGSLPVTLEVESLSAVGAGLGHEVARAGAVAVAVSLAALVGLLLLAYRRNRILQVAGLCALGWLTILVSGGVAALGLTLDLAGIAGLVLSVGMGMDAFLIVFERLMSDSRRLTPDRFRSAVAGLYSFSGEGRTLFHANATTLVVVALLLGTDRLASFATFLMVGLAASMVNILSTRFLLGRIGGSGRFRVLQETHGWRDRRPGLFRARRVYWASLALALILLLGLGRLRSGRIGPEFGAEFHPGSQIVVQATQEKLSQAKDIVERVLSGSVDGSRQLGDPAQNRWLLAVTESPRDEPETDAVPPALRLESELLDHGMRLEAAESVDARLSSGRLLGGLKVLGLSFALLAFYFAAVEAPVDRWFQARLTSKLSTSNRLLVFSGVLLAVVLDLALILAVLAAIQVPISLAVVAALLAIVGYSVNDSVVLWGHVQQQWRLGTRATEPAWKTPLQVVGDAVDEILGRAVLTTVSTAIPALVILVLGPDTLRDFAIAILVGTVAGTLSSLFVVGTFARWALDREIRGPGPKTA